MDFVVEHSCVCKRVQEKNIFYLSKDLSPMSSLCTHITTPYNSQTLNGLSYCSLPVKLSDLVLTN